MANQHQLALLQQGTTVWNTWRREQPEIRPDLSDVDLHDANLNRAFLNRVLLIRANLSKANLSRAFLNYSILSYSILNGADLNGANLSGADLSGANLSDANLSKADLSDTNFSGADLSGADLSGADLSDANLSKADLSGAILSRANLSGADPSGADLSGAFIGRTIFGGIDLRQVKGLETVIHFGPSTIGVDALLRSEGNIPESFLREAGLTDTFINYVHSLSHNTIEYYTCFISYSSQDDVFAKRLHADLQQRGVRCWFAPYSLRPGDLILERIDEAISLYDKLVLILSQYSVESRWVEVEVSAAKTKEVHQGCQMLFPLRLDETVMSTTTAWARSLREQRHIADFTGWKAHDTYQQAFTRLLQDLQPNTKPSNEP